MGVKARPVLERFIPKVRVIPCGGCWEWQGSTTTAGERNGDLARAFGVSPGTICDVVKRRIYT